MSENVRESENVQERRNIFKKISSFLDRVFYVVVNFIVVLKRALPSPPSCRFYPSCSEYALLSAKKYGIRAFPKIIWRILRCNPFSHGGVDYP